MNMYSMVHNSALTQFDFLGLLSTAKFIMWYFVMEGRTYDIVVEGELSDLKSNLTPELTDVRLNAWDYLKQVAAAFCGNGNSCSNSNSGQIKQEFYLNVSNRGNKTNPNLTMRVFWIGDTTLFRGIEGTMFVNCDLRVYEFGGTLFFSLRDAGKDPLDIGIEIWGGDPYDIVADWNEHFPAQGVIN